MAVEINQSKLVITDVNCIIYTRQKAVYGKWLNHNHASLCHDHMYHDCTGQETAFNAIITFILGFRNSPIATQPSSINNKRCVADIFIGKPFQSSIKLPGTNLTRTYTIVFDGKTATTEFIDTVDTTVRPAIEYVITNNYNSFDQLNTNIGSGRNAKLFPDSGEANANANANANSIVMSAPSKWDIGYDECLINPFSSVMLTIMINHKQSCFKIPFEYLKAGKDVALHDGYSFRLDAGDETTNLHDPLTYIITV